MFVSITALTLHLLYLVSLLFPCSTHLSPLSTPQPYVQLCDAVFICYEWRDFFFVFFCWMKAWMGRKVNKARGGFDVRM